MKSIKSLGAWPVPALASWALCWCLFKAALALLGSPWTALTLATVAGGLLAWPCRVRWRRLMVAGGFPLSALLLFAGQLPPWIWLMPAGLLLLVYPQRSWRDAPLFPTPEGAFAALPAHLPLPARARILDAGSGLGDGLRALQRAYPTADLVGIEWSAPLAWLARLRCPSCRIL
ncbi:MAG: class I SAM-dependent methyltransferase, partial [Paucibacter sp.]|nr:class I SAM-dependent methyltransferase [Roseateles sp.]